MKEIIEKLDAKAKKKLKGDKLIRYQAWLDLGFIIDKIDNPEIVEEIDKIRANLLVEGDHNTIVIKRS
jgi:hypothetical protein